MPRLTAAIIARNEAPYIEGCIASLSPLCDEIIVIDSGSTDRTIEIARESGVRVIERDWPGFPGQRNAALDFAKDAGWLLFLDADERLTPELRAEIHDALQSAGDDVAGFLIPRRNVIAGRIMRGGGWWPDYQARVLRAGRCRYDENDAVHEVPVCDGPLFALNIPLVHLNYRTWREFLAKQFGYQRATAGKCEAPRRRAYLGAPIREFGRRYIRERGYLDGLTGIIACSILGVTTLYGTWLARRSAS